MSGSLDSPRIVDEIPYPTNDSHYGSWPILLIQAFAIVSIAFAGRMFLFSRPTTKRPDTLLSRKDNLQFHIQRAHIKKNVILDSYEFLEGSAGIIEPNIEMEFKVQHDGLKSSYYEFYVCSGSGHHYQLDNCLKVTEDKSYIFKLECNPVDDEYQIIAVGYSENGVKRTTATTSARCMKLRRDINTVSQSELTQVLDSFYVIWTTPESVGRSLYGRGYHDILYFLRSYRDALSSAVKSTLPSPVTNYAVDDNLLSKLSQLTSEFEDSLRSVDEVATLPYLNFADLLKAEGILDLAEGIPDSGAASSRRLSSADKNSKILFGSKLFGSLPAPVEIPLLTLNRTQVLQSVNASTQLYSLVPKRPTNYGSIVDGRWASYDISALIAEHSVESATGDDASNITHAGIRGAWNPNTSPNITRYPSIVKPADLQGTWASTLMDKACYDQVQYNISHKFSRQY
jgi:hypothetical protein